MAAGERSPRILIINFPTRSNLGCFALLQGTISLLRIAFPSGEIVIHSPWGSDSISGVPVKGGLLTYDKRTSSAAGMLLKMMRASLRLLVRLGFRRRGGAASPTGSQAPAISDYEESDIVVNTGGDLLTEDYGSLSLYWWTFHIVAALMFKKKVVLFGESIGPYNRLTNRVVMSMVLRHCDLILVRESVSEKIAIDLGVPRERVVKIPDPSLAIGCSRVNDRIVSGKVSPGNRKGVIIAPSSIAWQYSPGDPGSKYRDYLDTFTAVVDRFVKNGIDVRLLPHVRGNSSSSDDMTVCRELVSRAGSPLVTLAGDVNAPEEVRAVIGACEMLIALRMHAALAGYATLTPTISVGYSHKFDGISRELTGSDEWFHDLRRMRLDAEHRPVLVEAIWKNWLNRGSQSSALEQRLQGLCGEFGLGINRIQELQSKPS